MRLPCAAAGGIVYAEAEPCGDLAYIGALADAELLRYHGIPTCFLGREPLPAAVRGRALGAGFTFVAAPWPVGGQGADDACVIPLDWLCSGAAPPERLQKFGAARSQVAWSAWDIAPDTPAEHVVALGRALRG